MTEKSTATKLQIKPDYTVYVTGQPDVEHLIGRLPDGARTTGEQGHADAALVFVANSAELRQRLTDTLPRLGGAQAVWICYPKGNKTDINRTPSGPASGVQAGNSSAISRSTRPGRRFGQGRTPTDLTRSGHRALGRRDGERPGCLLKTQEIHHLA